MFIYHISRAGNRNVGGPLPRVVSLGLGTGVYSRVGVCGGGLWDGASPLIPGSHEGSRKWRALLCDEVWASQFKPSRGRKRMHWAVQRPSGKAVASSLAWPAGKKTCQSCCGCILAFFNLKTKKVVPSGPFQQVAQVRLAYSSDGIRGGGQISNFKLFFE